MEQRVKNLEDLCELITKEVVEQNKNMIEMNKNLINEIRCLREAYVKQDDDFEEFKNLLRKIYDLNRQSSSYNTILPPLYPHPPPQPPLMPTQHLQGQNGPIPNNSALIDQINASMFNNLSFQSVQTPMHQNIAPSLNTTSSNYSIPSSASGMYQNIVKQTQSGLPSQSSSYQDFNQAQQVKPPPFNPSQPPPAPFQFDKAPKPAQLPQQPPVTQQAFKFAPSTNTTSTPQANLFSFKQQPVSAQQQQAPVIEKPKPPQFDFSPTKPLVDTKNKQQIPTSVTGPQQSVNNNLFAGANLFKTVEAAKPATTGLFSFGAASSITQPIISQQVSEQVEENDQDQQGGNPEEYEPQVDFKPVVQLKEVEVRTGEEEEDVLFKQRCKLYRFDSDVKEWKEKGVGDLKLLKHKQTNVIRVLMRRDQVLKLCANHRVGGDMKLSDISPKQLSWMANDFSDNESRSELLLAKFKTQEEAIKFRAEFEKAVDAMKVLDKNPVVQAAQKVAQASDKPSLSQLFKSDSWKCAACYAQNKLEDLKCACCSSAKPGSSATPTQTPATTAAPQGPKPFSFGLNQVPAQQQQAGPGKFDFGAKENILKNTPTSVTPTLTKIQPFSPLTLTGQDKQTSVFEKPGLSSFASLSAKNPVGALFGNTDASVSASPIFKPMGFGQSQSLPAKPVFSAPVLSTPKLDEAEHEGDAGENQNPEEYEPQVEFKPLVKLAEVDVKSGEENEEAVFKQRCKLYRYDSNTKEWKEKGTGEIKVLKHKTNEGMYRILMRRDQVLKLCANHRVTSDLKLEIFNDKQVRWYAQDYSEGEGKHELLAARFKAEEDAKKFKQAVEDAQKQVVSEDRPKQEVKPEVKKETSICEGLKPSLSEMFKKDKSWTCDACYVANREDVVKCAACASVRKGPDGNPVQVPETTPTQTPAPAPATPKFSFGMTSTQPQNQAPITFGQTFGQTANKGLFQSFSTNTTAPQPQPAQILFKTAVPSLFGAPQKSDEKTIDNIFGNKSGMSFTDLAKNTPQTGFSGGFGKQNVTTPFAAAAKPLFGAQVVQAEDQADNEAGENHNPEEYEPQIDFKPLVKLHEVEVKTGEEDEEVMFKQRCKLYRFSNQTVEWKEKGTGEIKILRHRQKENSYRILMRRDQVLKLCANHRITPEIKLEIVNEKQLRWMANDCSEGEPHTELLAVRFRHEEEAKKFREEFEKAQVLASQAAPKSAQSQVQVVAQKQNLSSLVKTEDGSWKCTACLTLNKPNAVKCACCETEKPKMANAGDQKDSGEIKVVYDAKEHLAEELIKKSRELKLSDDFYLYLEKPGCKGCPGCENEE